jgi:hypothetical protein
MCISNLNRQSHSVIVSRVQCNLDSSYRNTHKMNVTTGDSGLKRYSPSANASGRVLVGVYVRDSVLKEISSWVCEHEILPGGQTLESSPHHSPALMKGRPRKKKTKNQEVMTMTSFMHPAATLS